MTKKPANPVRRLGAPAAIAMFLASSFSASAMDWLAGMDPSILRGSFYPTCSECRVDQNGYLICRCVKSNGYVGEITTLRLTYCARDPGPWNGSGNLLCNPIIRGSWSRSCNMEFTLVRGNRLESYCAPGYAFTSIDLDTCPSMDIENINGQLRCRQ